MTDAQLGEDWGLVDEPTNGHAPEPPAEIVCADCGKTFARANHLANHRRWKHKPRPAGEEPAADAPAPEEGPMSEGERPPRPSKPRFGLFGSGERKAPRSTKRVSLEGIAGQAWGGIALALQARHTPTARMMTLQAPMAGMVLDEAAKGTFVDKALQPLARAGQRGSGFAALVLPPVLVEVISRNPELYPKLYPVLRQTMVMMLVEMAPVMKRQAKKEADTMAALKELAELGIDVNSVDAMIEGLFAGGDVGSTQG